LQDRAPGFLDYLRSERGLRPRAIDHYEHYLSRFEAYLGRVGLSDFRDLTPAILSAYLVDQGRRLAPTSLTGLCSTLRVFLRYLHRERIVEEDLSRTIERPRRYRQSGIPRSISWGEVRRVLEAVDRRTPIGKRDYAILLLLVTYGLRACEVAALSLDDIDYRRERLMIRERKAGHSTVYPLSSLVGEALLEYLRHGRPQTTDRPVFFRALAPDEPIASAAISSRAAHYLRKARVEVVKPGSHTLRHTCVQRLVDADFSFKLIGDYVGHRSPESTAVYGKVATEALREIAIGVEEEIL
jgi:site-specific recombinase XerD